MEYCGAKWQNMAMAFEYQNNTRMFLLFLSVIETCVVLHPIFGCGQPKMYEYRMIRWQQKWKQKQFMAEAKSCWTFYARFTW